MFSGLEERIKACWMEIELDDIIKLVKTLPDRIFKLITSKESVINY